MKAKTSFTTILCGALYLPLSCNKFELYIKQASFHQTSKQPLSSLPFHLCGNIFPTHFFMAKTGSRPSKCLFIALLLSQERNLFTALLLFQERQSFIKNFNPPPLPPTPHTPHILIHTYTHILYFQRLQHKYRGTVWCSKDNFTSYQFLKKGA